MNVIKLFLIAMAALFVSTSMCSIDGDGETEALQQLGMDIAYNTVKILLCNNAGDIASAAKHRRLREAFQAEIFERFGEAAAIDSINRGMEYYRYNQPSTC